MRLFQTVSLRAPNVTTGACRGSVIKLVLCASFWRYLAEEGALGDESWVASQRAELLLRCSNPIKLRSVHTVASWHKKSSAHDWELQHEPFALAEWLLKPEVASRRT
jgi:hypothetical protein